MKTIVKYKKIIYTYESTSFTLNILSIRRCKPNEYSFEITSISYNLNFNRNCLIIIKKGPLPKYNYRSN